MKKLNLGSGGRYLEGYINIDNLQQNRTNKVDMNVDVRSLDFEPNSIDEIYTRQLLQYFSPNEIHTLFQNWFRWLKPHGKLAIETSNLEQICKNIAKFIEDKNIEGLNGPHGVMQFYGIAGSAGHHWGWCPLTLSNHLLFVGFRDIRTSPGSLEAERDFCLECYKP